MTAEEYRQKYYLSDKIDGHLEEFALIKCQEMIDNWRKEIIENQGYLYPKFSDSGELEMDADGAGTFPVSIPQIPHDLLTK